MGRRSLTPHALSTQTTMCTRAPELSNEYIRMRAPPGTTDERRLHDRWLPAWIEESSRYCVIAFLRARTGAGMGRARALWASERGCIAVSIGVELYLEFLRVNRNEG